FHRSVLLDPPATPYIYSLSLHDALPIYPRSLEDFRGSFEDRVRVFPHEAVHIHAGVEFEDAGFVVGVLPHLLERVPSAILGIAPDRKSTRLNSSHVSISYAVFCLKKKSK